MRKMLLLLAVMLLFCAPALAETHVFDELYASMEMPSGYVVLTQNNLAEYQSWLSANGSSMEEKAADFEKRGVLLQAWTEKFDVCFELRANKTEQTELIFDVNEQTSDVRGQYRMSHYPRNEYPGYEYSSSEWKNTEEGRFLVLRYVRRDNSEVLYRGFMRRTIRNGYEIDFDMQIHGRSATTKDNTNLNKIWETFHFIEVLPLPAAASAQISISDAPPEETNEQSFEIKGSAAEGVHFTAVTMGLSHPDPLVSEVTVGKNGKFSLPIKLPREGVFLITLTADYRDQQVLEMAYPVTYQRTLLTVNFTSKPSGVITEEKVKIAGTAEPGATIQIFVNGENPFSKRVTNGGKFAFNVECKDEGMYEIALTFSKKGLADRRFVLNFDRKWTDEDNIAYLNKQSVSPAYAQLVKKMKDYEGRILTYRAYIVDVGTSGDQVVVTMALNRKSGNFSNYLLVMADDEPNFEVGERVRVYGTCEGMSLSTGVEGDSEDEEESYPCLELLMFAALE